MPTIWPAPGQRQAVEWAVAKHTEIDTLDKNIDCASRNEEGMLAASELFRNTHAAFADRGLPGSAEPVRQVPELVVRAKERLGRFYRKFDAQLANNEFVAGERYTVADPTALCAVDFGKWTDYQIPAECKNMQRWYEAVSARPSAKV